MAAFLLGMGRILPFDDTGARSPARGAAGGVQVGRCLVDADPDGRVSRFVCPSVRKRCARFVYGGSCFAGFPDGLFFDGASREEQEDEK